MDRASILNSPPYNEGWGAWLHSTALTCLPYVRLWVSLPAPQVNKCRWINHASNTRDGVNVVWVVIVWGIMIRKFSGARTQLAKNLPSPHEDLVPFSAWDEPDVLELACYPSTWVMEAERSGLQYNSQLHIWFGASPSSMRSYLNKTTSSSGPSVVSTVLGLQAWGTPLDFQKSGENQPDMVACACNLRAQEVETDGSLGLDGQPAYPAWQSPVQWETQSQKARWGTEEWQWMSSGLHTVHEYTLKPANTQTRSKTKYLSWPQHITHTLWGFYCCCLYFLIFWDGGSLCSLGLPRLIL